MNHSPRMIRNNNETGVKLFHLNYSVAGRHFRLAPTSAPWFILGMVLSVVPILPENGHAQAQGVDAIDLSPEELKVVHVYSASMYLQSDREAPASVTIITADQIHKFGYRTLAEILNTVRGFYASHDRNYSYIGVRGFSRPGDYNDRIQVLIDGHRMNDNVYGQALIGTEFPLDVDLIDRVEIVRGPSSAVYGTSAFFAVVNVITKDAAAVGGVELSADAGGANSYRGRASYAGTAHGLEWLLSGTIYHSAGSSQLFFPAFDSPATNSGIAKNADGDSSKSAFSRVKFGRLSFEALISTRDKNIPTASFGTIFNDPRTKTVDATGYLDLQYNRTVKRDTDVTLRLSYDKDAYHGVYADPSEQPQGNSVLNQDLEWGDWLTFDANVIRTLWTRHKITLGAEIQDNLRQDQSNYNASPYFLFLQDRRTSANWAVFGQDEFTLNRKLIFYAGFRHDQYQTFGGTTNPRFALIFTPAKSTTLKLIYGQAFRAPNNYELYFRDGFSVVGNPGLRPERIRSVEFAWEQGLGANYRISASVFGNAIANLIAQQVIPENDMLIYENFQTIRSRGLEWEVAGKTKNELEGRISYSLQRTEDLATGRTLSNSPAQLIKVSLTCPLLHRTFSTSIEAQYTSPRKTDVGTGVNRYATANFTATSREFAGGFHLSASIYNLFNHKYSDPVGTEIQGSILQQNGIDFRVQVSRAFHFY
jgi:outer membrane receptor for ferrienterochelin and colicins